MNERGQYGNRQYGNWKRAVRQGLPPSVGAFVHTLSEFQQAVDKLDTEFSTLLSELVIRMGANPADLAWTSAAVVKHITDPAAVARTQKAYATISKSPLYNFYQSYFLPLYSEWKEFRGDPLSFTEAMASPLYWGKIETWQARLVTARAAVEDALSKHGKAKLESPSPAPLAQSWADKAGTAAGDIWGGFKDVGSVLKWTLIGGLGLVAVIAVSSAVTNVKKGRDPIEPYVELAKLRRRPRALLAPTRLALPPGSPVLDVT